MLTTGFCFVFNSIYSANWIIHIKHYLYITIFRSSPQIVFVNQTFLFHSERGRVLTLRPLVAVDTLSASHPRLVGLIVIGWIVVGWFVIGWIVFVNQTFLFHSERGRVPTLHLLVAVDGMSASHPRLVGWVVIGWIVIGRIVIGRIVIGWFVIGWIVNHAFLFHSVQ